MRHRPGGRRPGGEQDRAGPDRVRHRRRHRHHLRCAAGGQRRPAPRAHRAQQRQDPARPPQAAREDPARPAGARPAAQRRAAHRAVDGEHAAQTAKVWEVSRESQDELAVASHHNLAAAYDRGFFDDLVTPFLGLTRDDNLRPDSTVEKLATLKPVFGKGEGATMTAANSTPLTDGASAVLLASDEWAAEHQLPVLAHLVDAQTAAVDYVHGGEGLLMAPAYAMPVMLARNGLTLQDFDLYEIHEAFASTVLSTMKAWEDPAFCKEKLGLDAPLGSIDRSKLNVNGSSLAAGHPFAATGGRIVASLAKALHELGPGKRGLISICAAGGQGVVAILES
ncbi:acetyl-CoA C-acyltransferase [Klenkia terrae]|uniref:acetyl-CoA C-acyltransferase n=1 Tax=Klenkia terrae TaxID=1052259 RepID=UPI0036099013